GCRGSPRLALRHFPTKSQLHAGLEFLIVGISDDLADLLPPCREIQGIDCSCVRREPVLVDLLAVGLQLWKQILPTFLTDIGYRLAVGLDDLKVHVVYPNLAFKVDLALLHL